MNKLLEAYDEYIDFLGGNDIDDTVSGKAMRFNYLLTPDGRARKNELRDKIVELKLSLENDWK